MRRHLSALELHDRSLTRMSPGTLGGRMESAAPAIPPANLMTVHREITETEPYIPFSSGDKQTPPAVGESGPYKLRRSGPLGVWVALLSVAGSSTTTAKVKLNGSIQGTVNLVSTDTEEDLDLSGVTGTAGDLVTVECTAVGTGAKGLVLLGPIV